MNARRAHAMWAAMKHRVSIRAAKATDLPHLHRLNQAAAPGVSLIDPPTLAALIETAPGTIVAAQDDAPIGFLLLLENGLTYDSPNYQWFQRRWRGSAEQRLYVDRIAVSASARGLGVGEALYRCIITAAPAARLGCEVNLAPPNPGSLRFHKRLGFMEVGQAAYEPGVKEVVFLERPPGPA